MAALELFLNDSNGKSDAWLISDTLHCGHLLGKGLPLGSRLWCLIVSLILSHWYPESGVVFGCNDSRYLPTFLLYTDIASTKGFTAVFWNSVVHACLACGFSYICNHVCSYSLQYFQLKYEVTKDNEAIVCSTIILHV